MSQYFDPLGRWLSWCYGSSSLGVDPSLTKPSFHQSVEVPTGRSSSDPAHFAKTEYFLMCQRSNSTFGWPSIYSITLTCLFGARSSSRRSKSLANRIASGDVVITSFSLIVLRRVKPSKVIGWLNPVVTQFSPGEPFVFQHCKIHLGFLFQWWWWREHVREAWSWRTRLDGRRQSGCRGSSPSCSPWRNLRYGPLRRH
jgi:hypothetical protein